NAFPGLSNNGFTNSSNSGSVFVPLKPVEERKPPELSANELTADLHQQVGAIQDAFFAMFPPPPGPGLGTRGGFKLQREDRNGLGFKARDEATKAFLAKAYQTPELA
ncbi:efflux RND transporter permease subunit, partial [Brucella oryzae]